ncbi:MAG: DUF3179 domain-containing protein [Pseudomonadales bacterium]|nr:DUF3179 domain-containing protein [Pseudomonadales bacterium]
MYAGQVCTRTTKAILMSMLLLALSSNAHSQATISGDAINIPVLTIGEQAFQIELTIVAGTDPIELLVTDFTELTDFSADGASTFDGTTLAIPSLEFEGLNFFANFAVHSDDPPAFVFVDAGIVAPEPPQSCVRPDPDPSHGPDEPNIIAGIAADPDFLADGGPGPDGIPAIENPIFTQDFGSQSISDSTLVVGVKIGDDVRAYSHTVMDHHEIVNDVFMIEGVQEPVSLNYCPLTGSAMLWKGDMLADNPTFGVSGQLYNSNLIMYDRETGSWWAQMLEMGINSVNRLAIPDRLQVIETNWGTWREMYPQTTLMTKDTGHERPYGLYPYGNYKTSSGLLFNVNNPGDNRLHKKARVVGINVGDASKVYPIDSFSEAVSVINDTVGAMDVVTTGSSALNFGAIFNRQLEDCTTLSFSAVQDQLPIVMVDNEGGEWDVFGVAVSGSRSGTQLQKTNSYIAYWFAWTAFFPGAAIYQ